MANPLTDAPLVRDWRPVVAKYQQPSVASAVIQLCSTLVPLALCFVLGYQALSVSIWLTLLMAIPAGGLLIKTFTIMHDCAHGSFFPSKRANNIVGFITGVLTTTPFAQWRRGHAMHHATSGDLDRRGHGDVDTITVREYLALSRSGRFKYRFARNPFVLFGIGPIHFVLMNRIPTKGLADRQQRIGVWLTTLAMAVAFAASSLWIGVLPTLLVYGPAMYVAGAAGIWLFYVQHQFEGTYWRQHDDWDYVTSAMRGSSYLRLPAVLQWFTGNIGLHHVHHLGPRIPNYALQRCHTENPMFHDVTTLTLARSLTTWRLTLWDEERQQLIGYRDIQG